MHVIPPMLAALTVMLIVPLALRAWDIGRALADALEECHVPRKQAAADMGIDEAQLSRQIGGTERLNADRLTRLPRLVQIAFGVKWLEHCGVVPSAETRAERSARLAARTARAAIRRDAREVKRGLVA